MVTESILYKNKVSERGVYSVIFGYLWLSLVIFGGLKGYLEYNVLRVCLLKIPPIGEMLKNPKKTLFWGIPPKCPILGYMGKCPILGYFGKGGILGILVKCSFLGK